MPIYALDQLEPKIDPSAFIADDAIIIGNVTIGPDASVWYGAVIRGDADDGIVIGARSNIQEGAVLHLDPGCPLVVGENVTVGHQAMLHGCTIGSGALVGIGAVVLNRAVIGAGCLVGAGALVTEGRQFDEGQMILGAPAKAVRTLDEAARTGLQRNAQTYVDKGRRFRTGLRRVDRPT